MDLRRYFSRGEVVRHFPARGQSPSVVRGITRCPGVCAWNPRLGFRFRVVPVGCAWNLLPHGRRRVDFLSEVGRRCPGEAVRRSSGCTACIALSGVFTERRAVNFSPRSKLCVKFFVHKASK
ncbi:hypothetical protein NDU88_006758 [Pleurodeles waltl]|uniref:Uncharacterized protein n=1 Tax=Pleurodeles waltl TaxID=8319 RepID=A0AAV7SQF6_PLEWA|nr:hypothetical protein NDU88_006758 [Pleurodeles waltl]